MMLKEEMILMWLCVTIIDHRVGGMLSIGYCHRTVCLEAMTEIFVGPYRSCDVWDLVSDVTTAQRHGRRHSRWRAMWRRKPE